MPRFSSPLFNAMYKAHCDFIIANLERDEAEKAAFIEEMIHKKPLMLLGCYVSPEEGKDPVLFLEEFQRSLPKMNVIERLQEPLALLFSDDSFPYSIDRLIVRTYNNVNTIKISGLDELHHLDVREVQNFYLTLLIEQPTLLNCLISGGRSLKDIATHLFEDIPDVMEDINIYYTEQQKAQHGKSKALRCVNVLTEQLTDGAKSLPRLIARHFALGINNVWLNPIDLSSTVTWSRTADYRTPIVAERVKDSKYARSHDDIIDPLFAGHLRTKKALDEMLILEARYQNSEHERPFLAPCIGHSNALVTAKAQELAIAALEEHKQLCSMLCDDPTYNITKLYSKPQMHLHRIKMSQHILEHLGLSDKYEQLKLVADKFLSTPTIKSITSELAVLTDPKDLRKIIGLAQRALRLFSQNALKNPLIKLNQDGGLSVHPDVANFIDLMTNKCPITIKLLVGNGAYSNLVDFAAYLPRLIKFADSSGIGIGINLKIQQNSKIFDKAILVFRNISSAFRLATPLCDIVTCQSSLKTVRDFSQKFSTTCQLLLCITELPSIAHTTNTEMCRELVRECSAFSIEQSELSSSLQHLAAGDLSNYGQYCDFDIVGLERKLRKSLGKNPLAYAKLLLDLSSSITSNICNPETWGSYTLLSDKQYCPTRLRSELFTTRASIIATTISMNIDGFIEHLRSGGEINITALPYDILVLIESNFSNSQREKIIHTLLEADDFPTPSVFPEKLLLVAEYNDIHDLELARANLCELQIIDDQIVRCVTNMAKCMGVGIMHDLVANHVSKQHPLAIEAGHLFCSSGSGTSFEDAITFNFYRPELGDDFVNTFVHGDPTVVARYGRSLNNEIATRLATFTTRKMQTLGFTGARVDCVRNIPWQIRQHIYRAIMAHSDPINAHIMEELLFCGNPHVEIPRWQPREAALAHTVTGISFFKERMWDGQVHGDVLDDAAMKRGGVRAGIINTVSNHDHNTAFNRVIERTALELMSHEHYTNSLGTIAQIFLFNANVETLNSAGLLRGCNLDKLRALYSKMHPTAIEEDEALQDRLVSILTFAQCTKIITAMEGGCLNTQSFVLKKLLDHIYTNALSGSAGYYFVNGDQGARLPIASIFVRGDGSPIQSSVVLKVLSSAIIAESREELLISRTASLFVKDRVNKMLSKPLVAYTSRKISAYKDRNGKPLSDISYQDVIDVLDEEGVNSLLAPIEQFVINCISANADHFIRSGGKIEDLVREAGTRDSDEISIQAMFDFIREHVTRGLITITEAEPDSFIASTILRTKPVDDIYHESRTIAKYLDAYNIFPTINNIIRCYTGCSGTPNLHSFQINDNIIAFLKFAGDIPHSKLEIIICSLNPGVTYFVDASDMKHLAVWLQKRYFADKYHHLGAWEDFARDHMGDTEFTSIFNAIMSPTSLPGGDTRDVVVHLTPGVNQGFQQDGYKFIKHNADCRKLIKIATQSGVGAEFISLLETATLVPAGLPINGLTLAREILLREEDLADKFARSPSFELSVYNPRDIDVIREIKGIRLPQRHNICPSVMLAREEAEAIRRQSTHGAEMLRQLSDRSDPVEEAVAAPDALPTTSLRHGNLS